MPKVTRSVEEVGVIRGKILDCAFKILVKNGFESLSMAKIGSRMKMTAANLYNYYSNKDELLIAIQKKAYAMLYEKLSYAVKMSATPVEKYKNLTYAFVSFGTQNINIYDIIFNRPIRQYIDNVDTPQESMSRNELRSSRQVLLLSIQVIREYRESRPDLEPVDPKLLHTQCFSALHGIILLHNSRVLDQISDDPDADMKMVIENTMRYVTG